MLREGAFSTTEKKFFDALIDACFAMEFYQKDILNRAKDYAKSASDKLSSIENFYDLNLRDFIKQLDLFFKKPQKQKSKEIPRIHTKRYKKKDSMFLGF